MRTLLAIAVAVLYLARDTAHQAIQITARALSRGLRIAASSEYLARVDTWKDKVEQGGGRWRRINDLERLEGLL